MELLFDLLTPEGQQNFLNLIQNQKKAIHSLIPTIKNNHNTYQLRAEPQKEAIAKLFALWESNICVFLNAPYNPEYHWPKRDEQKSLDDAVILLTSGSSGNPKGVVHTHKSLQTQAQSQSQYLKLSRGLKWGLTLPWHHVSGLMTILRAKECGGILYYVGPKELKNELKNKSIDVISLVPTQLVRLLDENDEDIIQGLQNLKVLILGGAMASWDLLDKARALNIHLCYTYGMTETAAFVLADGKPLNHDFRINEKKLIEIKGPGLFRCYLDSEKEYGHRSPDRHIDTYIDTYFETQDIGFQNPDGTFQILGRKDRIIISGGENINPEIIENELMVTFHVDNALVVPVLSREWGQTLHAFLDTTPEKLFEITQKLKSPDYKKLKKYEIPKHWDLWPIELRPQTPKISQSLKNKLIAEAHFSHHGQILMDHSQINHQQKHRPLLVFFHGFMGQKEEMLPLAQHINQFDQLLITLPGHKESWMPLKARREDIFNSLASFLKREKRDLILCGYSLGARICMELLAFGQLPIKALILIGGHPGLQNAEEKNERLIADNSLFDNVIIKNDLKEFYTYWYGQNLFANLNQEDFFEHYLNEKIKSSLTLHELKRAMSYYTLAKQNDLVPLLKQTKSPSLYLAGDLDHRYKNLGLQLLKDKAISAFESISGVGHALHLQKPAQVAQVILTFLENF